MTRTERILNEVKAGVLAKMEDTILGGDNRFHYEQEFGTAWRMRMAIRKARCWSRRYAL